MRYTYSFQLETPDPETAEIDLFLDIDLRKLIPVAKRNSRFLLKTSFHTQSLGDVDFSGLAVYLKGFPIAYNKTDPENGFIRVGTARPFMCQNLSGVNSKFMYSYTESECNSVVVDYPELSTLEVLINSYAFLNIPKEREMTLNLIFEEL